ncbi:MAG: hypothetical protein E6J90_15530 [Deltaproteobacteria bacterium]|nr:MAG: hypothetical protein E6J91_46060 [Deltaproteobacteria bacterium]TMQ20779.1 MAG: hypothetical protein E6J90_15530 [Deltaproteobacteria bacterium]
MRRAAALLVLLASALVVFSGLGAGCSREARPPAEPAAADEPPPPLPSASGSPIGFLLDDTRLTLRDEQRGKLRDIDTELAARLAYLDTIVRNAGTSAGPAKEDKRGGVGFSAGGGRGSDDAGKITVPDATGTGGGGGGLTPAQAAENAATARRVPQARAHDVKAAITKAMAVLDRDQQKIARQVLIDRGVDPDTGQSEAKGEPGVVRPEPPKEEPPRR